MGVLNEKKCKTKEIPNKKLKILIFIIWIALLLLF